MELDLIFDYSDGKEAIEAIMELPPDEGAVKLADILQARWREQVLALSERIINDLMSDEYADLEDADSRLARITRNVHHLLNSKLRAE